MIKYPESNPDSNCSAYFPVGSDVAKTSECLAFGDTITMLTTRLRVTDDELNSCRNENERQLRLINELQRKLKFAERQEEICGLLASGSPFSLAPGHEFTDSQLRVRELADQLSAMKMKMVWL